MELLKNKVFKLDGKVQHYAWGGFYYLSHLLKIHGGEKKPFAEYWMGAHDNGSAVIMTNDDKKIPLNTYIAAFPEETLGKAVMKKFGKLPYLLKILDVKDMLSIQVHPSKKNAEKEFADENKKGIDPDSPHRNYKDDNHKPELMMALSEFWLLHGFKSKDKLIKTLQRIPELNFLLPVFEKGYAALYKTVMEMDQSQTNEILQPLLDRIIPAYQNNSLQKNDENFWAARAALTFNQPGKIDRGIFSIYFFNLLKLQEGEAIFQDAGLPHAYLEGQNVEIMANSDNVLRGGLTPKHIDVNELLKHVRFEATIPDVIGETKIGVHLTTFVTPAEDFQLNKIALEKDGNVSLTHGGTNIFIVLKGEVVVHEDDKNVFQREEGQSWVSFDGSRFSIKASRNAVIYEASVPDSDN
ncbi:MAG: mannose-6-phosphate isomerase, class I [Bacteroidetes bacterium]|nr:mannose-6-phosphate isomerase, class I [Bacteroidota bacterium]